MKFDLFFWSLEGIHKSFDEQEITSFYHNSYDATLEIGYSNSQGLRIENVKELSVNVLTKRATVTLKGKYAEISTMRI